MTAIDWRDILMQNRAYVKPVMNIMHRYTLQDIHATSVSGLDRQSGGYARRIPLCLDYYL